MTSTDYQNQAREFLNECPATMSITYVGENKPLWDDKPHAEYVCIIKTQRGEMQVNFYDCTENTKNRKITVQEYTLTRYRCHWTNATPEMKRHAKTQVKKMHEEAKPTEYDILACLTKYDVGTMDDFITEFGYEIKSSKDITRVIDTYNAVVKEYRDICRCFTAEQIEKLREIN